MAIVSAIIKRLVTLHKTIMAPHSTNSSNVGTLLTSAYAWDVIADYARKQSEAAWAALVSNELIPSDDELRKHIGKRDLFSAGPLTITVDVTEPAKRFNEGALVTVLQDSKYKIPPHVTREAVLAAKVPTKSAVKLKIIETGTTRNSDSV